jgi:hypothetical protein
LKHVLRILLAVQQTPRDIEDQGAVPLNQGGKGVLLAVADKALQEVAVGENAVGGGAGQPLNVSQERAQLGLRHDRRLRWIDSQSIMPDQTMRGTTITADRG